MEPAPEGQLPRFPAAQYDLDALIDTHLFVISPNNSGSTFLRRSLELSAHVWGMRREGQHMPSFAGPHTQGSKAALIWHSTPERTQLFADPNAFDWAKSRKAWYFFAAAHSPTASVLCTSSPPFLLHTDALRENFKGCRFLFLTRDPYAVAEGVLRRAIERSLDEGEDRYEVVATHIGKCLEQQIRNMEAHRDIGFSLTYETMTEQPEETAAAIRRFLPQLDDYTLDQPVPVKGAYFEKARNMNAEAHARLSPVAKDRLREGFAPFADTITGLGYDPTGG